VIAPDLDQRRSIVLRQLLRVSERNHVALQSAIFHKRIPEPAMKIGSHKLFTAEEVEQARQYFEANRKRREARSRP